jgi:hypothetical protein
MGATLRCLCRRCGGGVVYFGASDFLDAHQGLGPGDVVLDRDVTVMIGHPRGHLAVMGPRPRSLFTAGRETLA